jgi:hypothetical protein
MSLTSGLERKDFLPELPTFATVSACCVAVVFSFPVFDWQAFSKAVHTSKVVIVLYMLYPDILLVKKMIQFYKTSLLLIPGLVLTSHT